MPQSRVVETPCHRVLEIPCAQVLEVPCAPVLGMPCAPVLAIPCASVLGIPFATTTQWATMLSDSDYLPVALRYPYSIAYRRAYELLTWIVFKKLLESPTYDVPAPSTNGAPFTMQGYLAHKKRSPPRTLQWDYYTSGPVVLGWAASYERSIPVNDGAFASINVLSADNTCTASEQQVNNSKKFEDFYLKSKAIIWP